MTNKKLAEQARADIYRQLRSGHYLSITEQLGMEKIILEALNTSTGNSDNKTMITPKGKVNILVLGDKLDLAGGAQLKKDVKALLDQGETLIHLDMTDVLFINSLGLGALVFLMKEMRTHKGRLTLSNLAPYVKEIFNITQLHHVFEIFQDIDEMIASYA